MIAGIFKRVSTTKEVQKDSLATQESMLREFCKTRGWEVHPYIYNETKSGTKENREEINKLLEDAKSGKLQVIVAKELSRLARNQEFSSKIIKQLKVLGVHLVTLDGAIDTTQNSSDMTGLFSWLYEFESQKISQRIKTTFRQKQLNSEFLGSNAPYGYRIEKKKLIIKDDETPDVIRRIFKLFQEGNGFDRIARILYNDNIPTPSQVANKANSSPLWHGSSVRKILENRNYTGDLSQGRETTYDVTISKRKQLPKSEHIIIRKAHKGIISYDEFDLVQELIKKRRKNASNGSGNATRPHEIIHLFTELLVCGACGKNYHYNSKNRNTYVCGRYNKHGSKACKPKAINEDDLMSIIRDDLVKFSETINKDNLYSILKKKQDYEFEKSKQRLTVLDAKIKNIHSREIKAMDNFMDEIFTKEQFDDFIKSQKIVLIELNQEIEELELKISNGPNEFKIDKVKSIVSDALTFNELNRATLNKFIDKIVVHEDERIEVFYKFSSTQNELNELMNEINQ